MSRIFEALTKSEFDLTSIATPAVALPPLSAAVPEQVKLAPEPSSDVSIGTRVDGLADHSLRIEEVLAQCKHPRWRPDRGLNVFSKPFVNPQVPEQFRTLRSRLELLRAKQSLRTLLITSAVSGEGKTFMTSNLAQAIARQRDRSVLMIDADLRCARLHDCMNAPRSPGLTDYLNSDADEMAVIQSGQGNNLFLIPGGNSVSNPSELLSNGRLKTLLDRVNSVFDWIILDSPPCLPVADASVISGFCDGVLLVVKANSTSSDLVQKACQELQSRNLVGVALNAVTESFTSYYLSGRQSDSNTAEDQPSDENAVQR